MKTKVFSEDFYKHLYKAIKDGAGDVEYDAEANGYLDTFYVDGYAVDVTVYYEWEVHDDSFDHAFGTWHDPHPYMKAECLDDIDEVKIRDEETGEEVEDFDYDAFWAQFEVPKCILYSKNKQELFFLSKGDIVLYLGREVVFLASNRLTGKLKLQTDKGIVYAERKHVSELK